MTAAGITLHGIRFSSSSPEEIVEIGRHIAKREKIAIADAAWPLLDAEVTRLRNTPIDHGKHWTPQATAGLPARS